MSNKDINPAHLYDTLAGKLARKLDAMDSNPNDGEIEASVWNEFVKDKGGNTIKESIDVCSAMGSITVYCCREGANENKTGNEKAKEWDVGLDTLNISNPQNDDIKKPDEVTVDTTPKPDSSKAETINLVLPPVPACSTAVVQNEIPIQPAKETEQTNELRSATNNDDGTQTITKFDKNGNVKKSRVALSWKDIGKTGKTSVKDFFKGMVCDDDGKVNGWKVAGAAVTVVAMGALTWVVGAAAGTAVAAAGAGTALAGLTTAATGATSFAALATGALLLKPLVESGSEKTINGAVAYHNAQNKEEAQQGMKKQMDGVVELASIPVLGVLFKGVGKGLNKIGIKSPFGEGKNKVKNESSAEKPKADPPKDKATETGKTPEEGTPKVENPEAGKAPEAEAPKGKATETGKTPEEGTPKVENPEAGKAPEAGTPEVENPEAGKAPEAEAPKGKATETGKTPEEGTPKGETPEAEKVQTLKTKKNILGVTKVRDAKGNVIKKTRKTLFRGEITKKYKDGDLVTKRRTYKDIVLDHKVTEEYDYTGGSKKLSKKIRWNKNNKISSVEEYGTSGNNKVTDYTYYYYNADGSIDFISKSKSVYRPNGKLWQNYGDFKNGTGSYTEEFDVNEKPTKLTKTWNNGYKEVFTNYDAEIHEYRNLTKKPADGTPESFEWKADAAGNYNWRPVAEKVPVEASSGEPPVVAASETNMGIPPGKFDGKADDAAASTAQKPLRNAAFKRRRDWFKSEVKKIKKAESSKFAELEAEAKKSGSKEQQEEFLKIIADRKKLLESI